MRDAPKVMTTMRTLTILFLGVTIFSCNQTQITQEKVGVQDTSVQVTNRKVIQLDTIPGLLDKALKTDTLQFDNWEPFLFFKSGNFLNKTEKNAVLVHRPTDTTYSIKLYSISDNKWLISDKISGLDGLPIQFVPIFDDYNFDGQTDIYIQATTSNGYPLSRGHLIIVNQLTKKLEVHPEARDLANMKPDNKGHSVISEEVIWCKPNGFEEVCKWTNKWVNGLLKPIKKDCPCEPE